MNHTYRTYSIAVCLLWFLFTSCDRKIKGEEYESDIVRQLGVRNHEFDTSFIELLPQINELMKEVGSDLKIKLSSDFDFQRKEEILLIPLIPFSKNISASSNIGCRFILINPDYINTIIYEIMLDPDVFKEIVLLIIIHELCHFEMGKSGKFDEIITESINGNRILNADNYPNFNESKLLELKVDSLAVSYIQKASKSKNKTVFSICNSLKKQLGILEASVAIDRITNFYGTPNFNVLNDLSKTHPNFELRIAFMNYYINPTESKKKMIDKFLEERETRLQN